MAAPEIGTCVSAGIAGLKKNFLVHVVSTLLVGIIGGVSAGLLTIGFMLCLIPGFLIMAMVPTAAYLVAVGEKDGINAIKRAFSAVKSNLLSAFFCALILAIVGSLGTILCGVGVIFTLPITFIGMYHMARQLTRDEHVALNA